MAGDWIKIERALPTKPETIHMATILDMDEDHVVGKLVRFWSWADEQLSECHANGVTKLFIDRYVGVTGFAEAMVTVGWLTLTPHGLEIPNFERHLSQTAKTRALAAERKRKQRQNVPHLSRSQRDNLVTNSGPEKRREEKSKEKTPLPPIPKELNTPDFHDAWRLWTQHRIEIKRPLTPTATSRQLALMQSWGLERAIAAIDHTIAMQWQGIREPERNPDSSSAMDSLNRKLKTLAEKDHRP